MTASLGLRFWQRPFFAPLVLLVAACLLVLVNLDHSMLWQDEAETACVSRTVLQGGIPKGYDGLNYFSQQEGREYGKNYEWKLHPWFQFYWQAAFFAVLGQSTFTARLPFALLGIGTVVFLYFLALSVWRGDRKTALWTGLLCLLSVTFLLLVRQSRYYAAVQFFSVYAAWAYVRLLRGERGGGAHYALATFLLFHSHYLFAMTFWACSGLWTLWRERSRFKAWLLWTLLPSGLCLPFLWWLLDSAYGGGMTSSLQAAKRLDHFFVHYGGFLFRYVFSPFWLLVPIAAWWAMRSNPESKLRWETSEEGLSGFFALLVAVNFLAIVVLSQEVYGRYLCAALPFALLLQGRFMSVLGRWQAWLPAAVLVVVVASSPMPDYLYELRSKYQGPLSATVRFLQQKMEPGDTVAISYGDLPLKFYFPEHKIYGGLTGEDLSQATRAQFIVLRHHIISDMDGRVHEYLTKNVVWENYYTFEIGANDSPFENRETPDEHLFRTPKVRHPLRIQVRTDKIHKNE